MSRLAKQSSRDITHVCFLELIIFPIISVDVDVVKCLDHSINVEAHVNKAVNQILVIALVSGHISAKIQTFVDSITLQLVVSAPPPEKAFSATWAWILLAVVRWYSPNLCSLVHLRALLPTLLPRVGIVQGFS